MVLYHLFTYYFPHRTNEYLISSHLNWTGLAAWSWLAVWRSRSSHERSYSTLSPVSTRMADRLRAGMPPRYVTKPTRSTQPCIFPGSLNWILALLGWGKGGNVTSARWQLTLRNLTWVPVAVRRVCNCKLIYPVTLLTYFTNDHSLGKAASIL